MSISQADFEQAKQKFMQKIEQAKKEYEEAFNALLTRAEEKKIESIRKDLQQ